VLFEASGNVYTTGYFGGTVDFDPGAGVFNLISAGVQDIFVSKLDASGNFIFAKAMGGTGSDFGRSIAMDASGNIYTTGEFNSATADFDPGAGVFNLPSVGSYDAFVSKLDVSGNFLWAAAMGGTNGDGGYSLAVDALANVYTTGAFQLTVDFNPSAGVFNLTSAGSNDIFVHKMASCAAAPTQPGAISGTTSLCSGLGATYSVALVGGATSYSWILPGGWSGSSTTNTISATSGNTGIFTVTANNACGSSLQQSLSVTVNPTPTISVNSGSICNGQTFTMTPSGGNTYTFQGGNAVVSPTTNTSYTVTGTSTAGCVSSSFATSNVTVNALPSISVNSGSICNGQSFTMTPNGANTYTFQGGSAIVSPTTNASYTVTGTSAQGCASASFATSNVTVNPLPTISASTNNTLICVGQSATLTANGASTYTWNPGGAGVSIIVSPTITLTYTINGTSAQGCNNSSVFTQSVSTCAGIDQIANSASELNVYPNPFNSTFIITGGEGQLVSIFNSLGSLIYKGKIEEEKFEINLEKEPSGIYFIKVGSGIKKIIKE